MSRADLIHKATLLDIIKTGISDEGQQVRPKWEDGTPAHTLSIFGVINRYNLAEEFPIVTLRPTAWKSGLKEILWIYQDKSNDVQLLKDKYNIHWWDSWTDEQMTVKKSYGHQMAKEQWYGEELGYMTQIDKLIHDLKHNPNRRMITNLYNHADLHDMTLAPCAFMTMWNVQGNKLNMTLIQRSSDYLVAGNINAVQYALLQHMIAQVTGYEVGMFNHYINDCHLYSRHMDAALDVVYRSMFKAPKLIMDKSVTDFYDFKPEHFKLEGYETGKQVKLEVAI